MYSIMSSMETCRHYMEKRLENSKLLDTDFDRNGNSIMTFEDCGQVRFELAVSQGIAVCYRNVTANYPNDHIYYIAHGLVVADHINKGDSKMAKRSYLLKGTIIEIKSPHGTFKGVVMTAQNFSIGNQPDDWYIELQDNNRGYMYWKQQEDGGGTMTVVQEVDNGL